jgi:hypothetical protein
MLRQWCKFFCKKRPGDVIGLVVMIIILEAYTSHHWWFTSLPVTYMFYQVRKPSSLHVDGGSTKMAACAWIKRLDSLSTTSIQTGAIIGYPRSSRMACLKNTMPKINALTLKKKKKRNNIIARKNVIYVSCNM